MKNSSKFNRAFTLIELLVVISIIAIITGIIITNLQTSRSKARDAQRISDISQMQLAINLYFDRCKQYPNSTGSPTYLDINSSCNGGTSFLTDYISKLPVPPNNPNQSIVQEYDYLVNTNPPDYILHIKLENPNQALQGGLSSSQPSFPSWVSGITCDPTTSQPDYCIGPK